MFWAYGTETPTDGYLLLNAGLGSDIYSKNGRHLITVVFILENLLDNTYQSHLSRLKYAPVNPATGIQGVFNMGMNFAFKVIVPYGIKG